MRFNFRGVGSEPGRTTTAVGETRDLIAVAAWLRAVRPRDALWLAGFSFGSYVAANAAAAFAPAQLISIAPPVERYGFAALPRPACPWLVVQGEDDDVAAPAAVYAWLATLAEPPDSYASRAPGTSSTGACTICATRSSSRERQPARRGR